MPGVAKEVTPTTEQPVVLVSAKVDAATKTALLKLADDGDRTISAEIRRALRGYVALAGLIERERGANTT